MSKYDDMSYRQLKELVPATPRGRMPRADKLKGEIFFTEEVYGAKVTIFKDGYLTYTAADGFGDLHTTVYSVHSCSRIVFQTGYSTNEYKEECGWYGEYCKIEYRIINGQLTRLAIVSEEAYMDEVWWLPIVTVCEERLANNEVARFRSYIEVVDDDDFEENNGNPEVWFDARMQDEENERKHEVLVNAMKTLTPVQYDTVELYYNKGLTEREVAEELGCTHQNVHKNLQTALIKLRNVFRS